MVMKNIKIILTGLLASVMMSSCSMFGLDIQEDYKYEPSTLDPHINISAKEYLLSRGKNPVIANDTVFKWMELGLEYAGIDLAEYEKPGRTFVFLNNASIRVRNANTGVITAGMWFDLPAVTTIVNGVATTRPANKWSDYSVETVRNYFLYLIALGDYSFGNAQLENTTFETLLGPGKTAGLETRLGYLVTSTEPVPGNTRVLLFDYSTGTGTGFDPEGKINFKMLNSDYSPLQVNNATTLATSGIISTNGKIHVAGATVYPSRY